MLLAEDNYIKSTIRCGYYCHFTANGASTRIIIHVIPVEQTKTTPIPLNQLGFQVTEQKRVARVCKGNYMRQQ